MKIIVAILCLGSGLALAEPAILPGGLRVLTINWAAQERQGKLPPSGTVFGEEPGALRVKGGDGPTSVTLWAGPAGLTSVCYAWHGQIRTPEVTGTGNLEFWSTFAAAAPGGTEERKRAENGPLGEISGEHPRWREIWIPFDGMGHRVCPSLLELKLTLPGPGTVELTNLDLVEFPTEEALWAAATMKTTGPAPGKSVVQKGLVFVMPLLLLAGMIAGVAGLRYKQRLDEARRAKGDANGQGH